MTDFSEPLGIQRGPYPDSNDTGQGAICRASEGVAVAAWNTDPASNVDDSTSPIVVAAIRHQGPEAGAPLTLSFPQANGLTPCDDLWLVDVLDWGDGQAVVVAEAGDFDTKMLYFGLITINLETLACSFIWKFEHDVRDEALGVYAESWPTQGWIIIGHNNGEYSAPPSFDNCFVVAFDIDGTPVFEKRTPVGYASPYTYSTYIYAIALNRDTGDLLLVGEWVDDNSFVNAAVWKINLLAGTPTWSSPGILSAPGYAPRWAHAVPVHEDGGWHVLYARTGANGVYDTWKITSALAWSSAVGAFGGISSGDIGNSPWWAGLVRDQDAGVTIGVYRHRNLPSLMFASVGVALENYTEEEIPGTDFSYTDVVKVAVVGEGKYVLLIGGWDLFPSSPGLANYGWGTLAAGEQEVDPEEPVELPANRQVESDRRTLRPVRIVS